MQMFLTPEEKIIEQLRTENEALKQQVEQGKRDAVPEGWVAIPIIPTDKQIRAMEDQWMRGSNIDMAMREYRAAIAAAPQPNPVDAIANFIQQFKRHIGGDGEFWLHELEDFYDAISQGELK